MPSLTQVVKMDVEGSGVKCERQAEYGYDTVQVTFPAVISVGDAINEPRLPVAQGDHGREEEAARDQELRATRASTPSMVGPEGSQVKCGEFKAPPQKAAGQIIEDEDTNETVEKIVRLARREEADLAHV